MTNANSYLNAAIELHLECLSSEKVIEFYWRFGVVVPMDKINQALAWCENERAKAIN